jgi:serine acetyltransferase
MISDIKANKQYKIKVLIFLWRLSQYRRKGFFYSFLFLPIHLVYWVYSQILLSIELPIDVQAEAPLIIWHGSGLVVNPGVKFGKNVVLRSGVVIGNNGFDDRVPIIENNVSFGANSTVIGPVLISEESKIGPNSFVNFNVEKGRSVISTTILK